MRPKMSIVSIKALQSSDVTHGPSSVYKSEVGKSDHVSTRNSTMIAAPIVSRGRQRKITTAQVGSVNTAHCDSLYNMVTIETMLRDDSCHVLCHSFDFQIKGFNRPHVRIHCNVLSRTLFSSSLRYTFASLTQTYFPAV
jgi:hypothetical protein